MSSKVTLGWILPLTHLLTVALGCTRTVHHQEISTLAVAKPWRQNVAHDRTYVAQIKASQHVEIRAYEKGYLQSAFVDEGQLVKKGQKLFQVLPMLVQAEFEKTKAEYEASDIEYRNTRNLAQKRVVSKTELALTKAKLNKAKASQDIAQAHLKLTTVTAPFDGMIDRFKVRLGSLVDEGELLTSLSDIDRLWVYFNVSERDYLNLMTPKNKTRNEAALQLILANGEVYDQKGKLDTIEADFDSETGNVAVRASFANPDRLLRHGETGNVVMTEMLNNVLVIPQKASFDVLDKKYVYVVDEKGVVAQREITIEHEVPHLYVVKTGVSENESVLLEGLGKVNKGQVIKAAPLSPSDVMKSLVLAAH